jgi:hypothetical protein
MAYNMRRASHGGDRRHNRSLAETLSYGKGVDEPYDEAVGPRDMTRRPNQEEWGPSAEGTRFFESDQHMGDVMGTSTGRGNVTHTSWESDPRSQYEKYVDEEQSYNDGWGY